MRISVCILLNHEYNFDYLQLIEEYLPCLKFNVEIKKEFPEEHNRYQLIVALSYQKIIKNVSQYKNVVIIHSSDLPKGRGWGAIYYSFAEKLSSYVVTVLFANEVVDAGHIIAQARFPIKADYTAPFLRSLDFKVSLILISKILERWPNGDYVGKEQIGNPSYRKKRIPNDNVCDSNENLYSLMPHLRGCEAAHPAFFYFNNVKYLIEVRPEISPSFPDELIIEFPGLNEK